MQLLLSSLYYCSRQESRPCFPCHHEKFHKDMTLLKELYQNLHDQRQQVGYKRATTAEKIYRAQSKAVDTV